VTDLGGDYSDIIFQNTNTGDLVARYLQNAQSRFGLLLIPSSVGTPGWNLVEPR
jgi:hypothetical protein